MQMVFQQALVAVDGAGEASLAAWSEGIKEQTRQSMLLACRKFASSRPRQIFPGPLFVQRMDRRLLAVIRMRTPRSAGESDVSFRIVLVANKQYSWLGADPFLLADYFEPDWTQTGILPSLEWQGPPPVRRTVAAVQSVLKRDNGPELLGGSQVLLDGGKLCFIRPAGDEPMVRDLWALLPHSNRCELMPATMAWNRDLNFDIAVVPADRANLFKDYMDEEHAGQYPEGGYELSLQIAAEADDQERLDELLSRRSRREVWRMGWMLLAAFLTIVLFSTLVVPQPPKKEIPAKEEAEHPEKPAPKKEPANF